eukprot:20271_5
MLYGRWLFGKYSEVTDVDEEIAAEMCYQLLQGQLLDLLAEYIRQKYVVYTMLGGRYRNEFFRYWLAVNGNENPEFEEALV